MIILRIFMNLEGIYKYNRNRTLYDIVLIISLDLFLVQHFVPGVGVDHASKVANMAVNSYVVAIHNVFCSSLTENSTSTC